MGDPTAYFSDMLWRNDKPAQGDQAAATAEGGRIQVSWALFNGNLPAGGQDLSRSSSLPSRARDMSFQPDACRRSASRTCLTKRRSTASSSRLWIRPKRLADAARKTGSGSRSLGLHLTIGRRFLGELHGYRWWTAAGRSAAI